MMMMMMTDYLLELLKALTAKLHVTYLAQLFW